MPTRSIAEKSQVRVPRVGRNNAVGVAFRNGLDGERIESQWSDIFRTHPDRPCGPPSLLYNEYRVFPGDKTAGVCS